MTLEMENTTAELVALLSGTNLKPRFGAQRPIIPAQYDALYALCMTACAIVALAKPSGGDSDELRLNNSLLKFAQFIASRPRLLRDYLLWREHRREGAQLDLQSWPLLPRGFLTDQTPTAVLGFLSAIGELERDEKDVVFRPKRHKRLHSLIQYIGNQNLFISERSALKQLSESRPTLAMLGVQ
jgi:hypothetical protein